MKEMKKLAEAEVAKEVAAADKQVSWLSCFVSISRWFHL